MRPEARNTLIWISLAFMGYMIGTEGVLPMHGEFDASIIIYIPFLMAVFQMTVAEIYLAKREAMRVRGTISPPHQQQQHRQQGNNTASVASVPQGIIAATPGSSTTSSLVGEYSSSPSPVDANVAPQLDSLLRRPGVADMFENHLISELGIESLNFLQDTSEWKLDFHDTAPTARLARAKRLVRSYVESDGLMAINIPGIMSEKIKKTILNAKDTDLSDTVFDDARREISSLLEVGAVPRFLNSKEFRETQAEEAVINAIS
jgi:hypothetical protein